MTIRAAEDSDADALASIYNHYIRESIATFEEDDVDAATMRGRLEDVRNAGLPWLVCEENGQVTGYAYATQWRSRSAYRYSAEITVYLHHEHCGRGLGSRLYAELIDRLRECGVHTILGGISLPNEASVALHERFGMQQVAHLRQVGFKFGQWIDVGYWQRVF